MRFFCVVGHPSTLGVHALQRFLERGLAVSGDHGVSLEACARRALRRAAVVSQHLDPDLAQERRSVAIRIPLEHGVLVCHVTRCMTLEEDAAPPPPAFEQRHCQNFSGLTVHVRSFLRLSEEHDDIRDHFDRLNLLIPDHEGMALVGGRSPELSRLLADLITLR